MNLDDLNYTFQTKPLVIGGMAMEYYGLRKTGADIDLVVTTADYLRLARQYPYHKKDLYGDLGVCVGIFEVWKCIMLFEYAFLADNAIELETFKIISLDKLLFLKALAAADPKCERDLKLIIGKIHNIQYGKDPDYSKSWFQAD